MTWAIDPARSLFYYDTGDNASFYASQNRNYRPSFEPPSPGLLEVEALETCSIAPSVTDSSQWSPVQRTCYYDIAVTGDLAFGRASRQAAEQQVEQREAMRNPPVFNSDLTLTRTVRVGQQVTISFRATSEFSSNIAYKLLHGPTGSSLNGATGAFEWKVPKNIETSSKVPVQVSAQDSTHELTSTYEVLLDVEDGGSSNARALTTSTILMLLALISNFTFQ